MYKSIVSSSWLFENLKNPNLIILDASLANHRAKLPVELQEIQIKGARFFDLKNKFSDTNGTYPTTFPTATQFETECQNLGINNDSHIVIYDINGIYSSPRAWWLFKSMGHENVSVLDGGFPDWLKNEFPTEKTTTGTDHPKGNFKAKLNTKSVRFFDDIHDNLNSKKELIIDVRSKARFDCLVDEPRAGLRRGNFPNSVNLPYTDVLENGKFKSKEERITLFKQFESEQKPLTFSCGSGITACVVLLAAQEILKNDLAIYDGSWTEWGDKTEQ